MNVVPQVRRCLIAVLLMLSVQVASGQITYPPPCSNDCPPPLGGPWIGPITYGFSMANCAVSVTILYRFPQDGCGKQEFSIIDISINPVGGCTFHDVLAEATRRLVKYNPMGFTPQISGDPCAENWKMTNSSCWKEVHEQVTPNFILTHYQPCSSAHCCYVIMKVCIDPVTGERTGQNMGVFGTTDIQCNGDCPYFSCESMQGAFPPVSGIQPNEPEDKNISVVPASPTDTNDSSLGSSSTAAAHQ